MTASHNISGHNISGFNVSQYVRQEETFNLNVTNQTDSNVSMVPTTVDPQANYDSEGAMRFIVATVLVYSIFGVFCTLLSRIKRSNTKKHLDIQLDYVAKYLERERTLKFCGHRAKLMRECSLVSEKVKEYEEKERLRTLGQDLSRSEIETNKRLTKSAKAKPNITGTVGKMGLSLVYLSQSSSQPSTHTGDTVTEPSTMVKLNGKTTGSRDIEQSMPLL